LSVADNGDIPLTIALQGAGVAAVTNTLAGQMITGGTSSMVCISVTHELVLPHQSVTTIVIGKTPHPVSIAGLTEMDWIWQLSDDPPSINPGVTKNSQFASSVTPNDGTHIATGGILSVTVIVSS
jgi:hypothetical protein